MALKWAAWLNGVCHMRGFQCFRDWGIKSHLAHNWDSGVHNPCRVLVPNAFERRTKSEVAHKWAGWLQTPCRVGVPIASERGTISVLGDKWGGWLHNPGRLRGPQRFRAGDKIRGGPQVGQVAT